MSAAPLTWEAAWEERGLEFALHAAAGRTLALVGPNGAGKSSALGVAAGTLRADRALVRVGETVLTDTGRPGRRAVPVHRRGVGLLAQQPLLFPHLSVRDNVAFGLRAAGRSRREAARAAEAALEQVGARAWERRRPRELSGGQAARVALARAVAPAPRVLLLDEPFAALDAAALPGLRGLVREVLRGRTAVLVTHDPLDALLLADDVAVLERGRVVDQGPVRDVLDAPRTAFTAELTGLNVLRGTVSGGALETGEGVRVHAEIDLPSGSAAVAVVDPAAVAVHLDPTPLASPRNVWPATVTALEPRGRRVLVRTDVAHAEITPAAVRDLDLQPGSPVHLVVKATEISVHPAVG